MGIRIVGISGLSSEAVVVGVCWGIRIVGISGLSSEAVVVGIV